ncbi:hypothetical protein PC119_g21130 [Phytophthora cactorum]|uniref:Uncharacterized protein n=1 Tax=Phytophthora cactorum TaxID=29920 RepID=A0A8T1BRM2_9STRA|nr:hypothetical protein PC117_g19955 [Phytophthora cactorum]KAG2981036.1 hypothetical protein PC119_g21130 [Phytophthora cactorum]
MQDSVVVHRGRLAKDVAKISLTSHQSVIALDRLNYALRTGATVNVMVLNTLELLDRQSEKIVACGKSRSGFPTGVVSTMLSVPIVSDETSTKQFPGGHFQGRLNMAFSASDDEAKAEVPTNERSDIDLVRLQNQPLRKRDADANVPDRRRTDLPGC